MFQNHVWSCFGLQFGGPLCIYFCHVVVCLRLRLGCILAEVFALAGLVPVDIPWCASDGSLGTSFRKHSLKDTAWTTAQRCKQNHTTRGRSRSARDETRQVIMLGSVQTEHEGFSIPQGIQQGACNSSQQRHARAPPRGHRQAGPAPSLPGRRCHEDSDEQATPPLSRASALRPRPRTGTRT